MASSSRALLVVDAQPTFCEGGALPSPGANAVCEAIAVFVAERRSDYAMVVTTQDWHIDPGRHFALPPQEPDFVDTWPPHGVAGTAEAELHPALADLAPDAAVKKGQYTAAYSGFEGTDDAGRTLAEILEGIDAVDVVGLVESHCVKETALDAVRLGKSVRVFTDLTVPVTPDQGATAQKAMQAASITLTPSP